VKTVYLAETPLVAHLVAGILREAGIEVLVEGEALQGARGEIPVDLSTRPAVRVLHDEDADRAVRILAERRRAVRDADPGGAEEEPG
jgi:hypothetical protein